MFSSCVSSFGWLVLRLWMQTGQVCRSGSLPAKRSLTLRLLALLACGASVVSLLFSLACALRVCAFGAGVRGGPHVPSGLSPFSLHFPNKQGVDMANT